MWTKPLLGLGSGMAGFGLGILLWVLEMAEVNLPTPVLIAIGIIAGFLVLIGIALIGWAALANRIRLRFRWPFYYIYCVQQLEIKVQKAQFMPVGTWGPGTGQNKPIVPIEVQLTFIPTKPPIQLGRFQLCCGNERIDGSLPTNLIERVESYLVRFESETEWAAGRRESDYYGRICALAGKGECFSDEFRIS